MKQALILCGGKAQRLQPYSHILPKACMPFLNLPLLSLNWFYMEQLGVSHFLLNAHLFPEKLKHTVNFLSQPQQKTEIFFEDEPLGGAGTLYKLKPLLQKEKTFFYLNGDSLFFPSDQKQLFVFEKSFLDTKADGSFFASPRSFPDHNSGDLWCDKDRNLKFIGSKKDIPKELNIKELWPFQFSGLALFQSSLLESLKPSDFHLFQDFINPLLKEKKLKVFADKDARILEAGEKQAYIESSQFCLECLFEDNGLKAGGFQNKNQKIKKTEDEIFGTQDSKGKKQEIKNTLEKCFARFDTEDQIVGLKNGREWSKTMGFPLLAPKSVQALENLKLKGFAILGSGVHFLGKSSLKDSVLDSQIFWKGTLDNDIVLNSS